MNKSVKQSVSQSH